MSAGGRSHRPVVFLMGPTGAGKTAAALWLAARFPLEIVSVDSALVYRGFDIGTAKPDPGERRRVPHHLIDVCEPTEAYSVGRFCAQARAAVAAIHARGRLPLLVGGTGLYFRMLEHGIAEVPAASAAQRDVLQLELATGGSAALHARLARVDPDSARRIHPNDPQRITRALEVHATTGRPLSTYFTTPGPSPDWTLVKWVLAPTDREVLRTRLATRFAAMLERGFINEVALLRARGDLGSDCPALRAVGYRQIWAWLEGECTREEMVTRAVIATRQYAKRQYTWFRRERDARWFDSDAPRALDELIADLGSCAEHISF